jgi:hypothetical protein
MFALVTREVRAATRNQQRPYKYASLDGIFCVALDCKAKDIQENATPASGGSSLVATQVAGENWALFNLGGNPATELWFVDTASVTREQERVWARIKVLQTEDDPARNLLKGSFTITDTIQDCLKMTGGSYGFQAFGPLGEKQKDVRVGDPRTKPLTNDSSDKRTFAFATLNLLCAPEKLAPLLELTPQKIRGWDRFYSLGELGDLYVKSEPIRRDPPRVTVLTSMLPPRQASLGAYDMYPFLRGINSLPSFSYSGALSEFDCSKNTIRTLLEQTFNREGTISAFLTYQEQFQSDGIIEPGFLEELKNKFCLKKGAH